MTSETFKAEIARLKSEWGHSFGAARCEALWLCYRGVSDEVFHDAVTAMLLNPPKGMQGPGQEDFERAVNRIQTGKAGRGQSTGEKQEITNPSPSVIARVKSITADFWQNRVRPQPKLSARDRAAGEQE